MYLLGLATFQEGPAAVFPIRAFISPLPGTRSLFPRLSRWLETENVNRS